MLQFIVHQFCLAKFFASLNESEIKGIDGWRIILFRVDTRRPESIFTPNTCPLGELSRDSAKQKKFFSAFAARKFANVRQKPYLCTRNKSVRNMTALELNAELYRAMGEIANNETLLAKVLAYVKSLVPAKETKTETGWADRFVGAWKDDRSADEIVNDIRSARTANEIDIEL